MFENKAHLYDTLEAQAGMVHDAASALVEWTASGTEEAEATLNRVEESAARLTADVEQQLRRSFTLKIDRGDLQELSSALRSALVVVMRAVRTALAIGTGASDAMRRLANMIVDAAGRVVRAVEHLRTYEYDFVAALARELRTLQRSARAAYDEALGALLKRDDVVESHVFLRESLILESLKQVIESSRAIGSLLSYVAVKNS